MPLVSMRQLLDEAARGAYKFAQAPDGEVLKPARAAMQELIAGRMRDFGQAGHAGDYESISLDEVRAGYAAAAVAV